MYRSFLTVVSILGACYGIGGILATDPLLAAYGITPDATAVVAVRMLCAAYLGVAVVNWLLRDAREAEVVRANAIGNAIGWSLTLAIVLLTSLSRLLSPMGLAGLAIQVLFTLGWAYFAMHQEERRVASTA